MSTITYTTFFVLYLLPIIGLPVIYSRYERCDLKPGLINSIKYLTLITSGDVLPPIKAKLSITYFLNYRIAKAMRESESYNRTAAVGATAENRNRKTVVRIQSKIAYIK